VIAFELRKDIGFITLARSPTFQTYYMTTEMKVHSMLRTVRNKSGKDRGNYYWETIWD